MIELLLKVTFVLALSLCVQSLLRNATAALRHLVCAVALLATALMPLTLVWRPEVAMLQIPMAKFSANAPVGTGSVAKPSVVTVLFGIWVLGATLVIARLLIGHWRIAATRRAATLVQTTARIPVYQADIAVPLAVGFMRPAILLPLKAVEWPVEHRNAALLHETAHIHRKDLWTNLLAHLVTAGYWFHPLVWAVARRLREEQELACDDVAVTAGTPPELYAEALLAVARFSRPPTITDMTGCPMIARTSLQNRIARLVNTSLSLSLPRTLSAKSVWRAAAVTSIIGAGVALVTAAPQTSALPQPDADQVYRVGKGVTAPSVVSRSDPEYTEEARVAKVAGTVLLQIVVGKDGKAHHINVLKGLDAGLDFKAVEAVQRWVFNPGTLNGEAVDVRAQVEINFRTE